VKASIRTGILELAFEEGGPPNGIPVLLIHGRADTPREDLKTITFLLSLEGPGLDIIESLAIG